MRFVFRDKLMRDQNLRRKRTRPASWVCCIRCRRRWRRWATLSPQPVASSRRAWLKKTAAVQQRPTRVPLAPATPIRRRPAPTTNSRTLMSPVSIDPITDSFRIVRRPKSRSIPVWELRRPPTLPSWACRRKVTPARILHPTTAIQGPVLICPIITADRQVGLELHDPMLEMKRPDYKACISEEPRASFTVRGDISVGMTS